MHSVIGDVAADPELRYAVEALLRESARALDERRLEDWAELFDDEGSYTVVPRGNLERGLPLCIMADDSKGRIRDRVLFVRKIWAGNFTEYIPRHLCTTVAVARPDGAGLVAVQTNFAVYASEPRGSTLLLAVGEYHDLLTANGARLRFRERQVVVDTEILPRYLVYPL